MEFAPEKWEVVGVKETGTASHCSCGHDITYNFPMRNKESGKIIPIGSVCIESAPFMPPELVVQYKEIIARLKAERKAAELLRQAAIKGELEQRYNKNCETFMIIYKSRGQIGAKLFGDWWQDSPLHTKNSIRYSFCREASDLAQSIYKLKKKKLKTAKGYIKNYTKILDDMQVFNNKYKLAMILYSSNVEV